MDRGRQQLPELSGLLRIGRPGGTSGCATTGGATPVEKWLGKMDGIYWNIWKIDEHRVIYMVNIYWKYVNSLDFLSCDISSEMWKCNILVIFVWWVSVVKLGLVGLVGSCLAVDGKQPVGDFSDEISWQWAEVGGFWIDRIDVGGFLDLLGSWLFFWGEFQSFWATSK